MSILSYQQVLNRSKENIYFNQLPYNIDGDQSYLQLLAIFKRWQGVMEKPMYGAIGDAGWVYVKDDSPFAYALDSDRFRLVVCSTGLFHFINSLNYDLYGIEIANDNYFKNLLIIQKDCSELFTELASFFLFFHEYAHLRQYKLEESVSIQKAKKIDEKYQIIKSSQIEDSHKKEFDADFFASSHSAERLIVMWKGMHPSIQKREILLTFCGLSIAVYTFMFYSFYKFSGLENAPFYINTRSHPHPFVRMKYTTEAFKDKINDFDFGFDKLTSEEIEYESGKFSSYAFGKIYGFDFRVWTQQFARHNPNIRVYCKNLEGLARRDVTKTIYYRS